MAGVSMYSNRWKLTWAYLFLSVITPLGISKAAGETAPQKDLQVEAKAYLELLTKCVGSQLLQSTEWHVPAKKFMAVLDIYCRERIGGWISAMYRALVAKGYSHDQAKTIAGDLSLEYLHKTIAILRIVL